MSKNRIVVYTALFGSTDELLEPKQLDPACDYICFTDNPKLKSGVFKIILVPATYKDPTRNSRMYKLLPHIFLPQYEYSLWLDGRALLLTGDINGLITKYLKKHNLAIFKHMQRETVMEEALACIERKKDNPFLIIQQMEDYKAAGFPDNKVVVETGVLLRRHNRPDIAHFSQDWWYQLLRYTKRDQLSFAFVAWQNYLQFAFFDGFIWENPYFQILARKTNSRFVKMDYKEQFKEYAKWIYKRGTLTKRLSFLRRLF